MKYVYLVIAVLTAAFLAVFFYTPSYTFNTIVNQEPLSITHILEQTDPIAQEVAVKKGKKQVSAQEIFFFQNEISISYDTDNPNDYLFFELVVNREDPNKVIVKSFSSNAKQNLENMAISTYDLDFFLETLNDQITGEEMLYVSKNVISINRDGCILYICNTTTGEITKL